MTWDKGCSRFVILTRRYAIKLPNFTYRYPAILWGLLHNISEAMWWKAASGLFEDGTPRTYLKLLCPVVWTLPGGLLIVMRRADPLPRKYDTKRFWRRVKRDFRREGIECPAELKLESFGILEGRIVAIDYA